MTAAARVQDFGDVPREPLADLLASRIQTVIDAGGYAEGERLPTIQEMARRFGVGTHTVREAVKKLQALGVLDVRHGLGVFVAVRRQAESGPSASYVADPQRPPANVYMYTLAPTRPGMLTDGATDDEKALAAQHWAYSRRLLQRGTVIFAGRTMTPAPGAFAMYVIRADSERSAREIMEADPAVRGGVYRAHLVPYQPMLIGRWVGEESNAG